MGTMSRMLMVIRSSRNNLTRFMKRMTSTSSSVGAITKDLWSGIMSLDALSPAMTIAILLVTMLILVIMLLIIILLALVTTQSLSCTRVMTVCMPSSGPVMLTSMLTAIVIMVTIIWATGS